MFSKQFITIPHWKDLYFRVNSHAFKFYFHTLMWKPKTFSNFEWCCSWNKGVVGSWTTWFLDFGKRGAWNKRGDATFGPLLINVVAEITELWVGNFQKINCRDVTSIREGRVWKLILMSVQKGMPFPVTLYHTLTKSGDWWGS